MLFLLSKPKPEPEHNPERNPDPIPKSKPVFFILSCAFLFEGSFFALCECRESRKNIFLFLCDNCKVYGDIIPQKRLI